MNRRIALLTGLLLVLFLAALPVLAGCGDDETTTDTTEAAETVDTTETSDATEDTTETSDGAASGKTYNIGITQIVSHPALDAVAQGFKDALEEEGIQANFDEQNAQGLSLIHI